MVSGMRVIERIALSCTLSHTCWGLREIVDIKVESGTIEGTDYSPIGTHVSKNFSAINEYSKEGFGAQMSLTGTRYWLDSKTAICCIQKRGEWKQFVRHRVNEILRLSNKKEWRHCPGEENPADIGSRGEFSSKLKDDELWWKGPPWLLNEESSWPASQVISCTPERQEEVKKTATVMIVDTQGPPTVVKAREHENKR